MSTVWQKNLERIKIFVKCKIFKAKLTEVYELKEENKKNCLPFSPNRSLNCLFTLGLFQICNFSYVTKEQK